MCLFPVINQLVYDIYRLIFINRYRGVVVTRLNTMADGRERGVESGVYEKERKKKWREEDVKNIILIIFSLSIIRKKKI